jgi:hypothetical protein
MVRKLLVFVIAMVILAFYCNVYAEPFFTCDPQEGVETYKLTFPGIPLEITSPATADGALMYDLGAWTGPEGWHSGEAKACATYELEDTTAGTTSSVEQCGEASPFRLKIPKLGTPSGYKLQ